MPKKKMTPARTIQKNVFVRFFMLPPLVFETSLEKLFCFIMNKKKIIIKVRILGSDKLDHDAGAEIFISSVYKTPYFMI